MKKIIILGLSMLFLAFGCPGLAIGFGGDSGMAICFILFFAINPLFSILCGALAGTDIKGLWFMPIAFALLFILGAWIFFDFRESAFLLYGAAYLFIAALSMTVSYFIKNRGK